jgi:hypothetical protein
LLWFRYQHDFFPYSSDFWLLAKSYARRFEDRYRKIRQEFDVGEDDVPDEEGGNNTSSSSNNNKTSSSGTKTPKGSSSSASNLSDAKSPSAARPSLDARAQFGSNLFLLSGMELGHVISMCEEECPECLENVPGGRNDCHIEINVDLIPTSVFDVLNTYVSGKVSGGGSSAKSAANGTSTISRSGSPSTNSEKKGPGRPKKKQKKE